MKTIEEYANYGWYTKAIGLIRARLRYQGEVENLHNSFVRDAPSWVTKETKEKITSMVYRNKGA